MLCRKRLLGTVYRKGLLRMIYRKRLLGTMCRKGLLGTVCRKGFLGTAYRKGLLRTVYWKGLLGTVYQKGLVRTVYQKGVPFLAVESVIFHQLPTSVTRNGRATFVSVIPSYSVEWRIEAMSHLDGPRPCGALTIYLCFELKS
jgi:hypothetical protein